MNERVLLVTGASGHLGREAVERLLARGTDRVVAGTRDPSKLADLAAKGVEVRRLDFDDEASMAAAFQGVDRALVVSADALERGRRGEQHVRAIRAATAAGVGHLVYTSFTNPAADSAITLAADHRATEEALAASGVGYTSLRNNLYADYLLQSVQQALTSGQLFTARGDGATAYVTRSDCAAAAAAALADTFQGTRTLEITGPAALTGDRIATVASEASGKQVTHVSVPPEAFERALLDMGLPAPLAAMLTSFEVGIARGELAAVGDGLDVLGVGPATPVLPFLVRHLAVGGA